jgi:hypothetical protein
MAEEIITVKQFADHCKDNTERFDKLEELLKPIVDREVKVDWAAKQVVKFLKVLLLILSVLVAAFAVIEKWKVR